MRYSLIIIMVIMLHLVWSGLLFVNGAAIHSTAIDGVVQFFQPYGVAALALFIAGVCGILGIRIFTKNQILSAILFTPMEFLLLLSAITVVQAMYRSHFADGVIRSRLFIISDQVYLLIIVVLFIYAILYNFGTTKKFKWNGSHTPH